MVQHPTTYMRAPNSNDNNDNNDNDDNNNNSSSSSRQDILFLSYDYEPHMRPLPRTSMQPLKVSMMLVRCFSTT